MLIAGRFRRVGLVIVEERESERMLLVLAHPPFFPALPSLSLTTNLGMGIKYIGLGRCCAQERWEKNEGK